MERILGHEVCIGLVHLLQQTVLVSYTIGLVRAQDELDTCQGLQALDNEGFCDDLGDSFENGGA